MRNRCAFIVCTDSGQVNVQRQDMSMLVYDMLTKGSKDGKGGDDAKFMDAMLQIATGTTTPTTGLTWEVHHKVGPTTIDLSAIQAEGP